jgi:large subunit ribosomal protein L4
MAEKKTTTKKAPAPKVSPKKEASETTLSASIYNTKGTAAGTIALPEDVFGVKWNNALVHQVITGMLSNARTGTAHTKDRGEVRGGGKKPWKQKGTGRARHGSSRSPIWVGGGATHGPRNEKDYSKKINRKMAAKALFALLSKKYKDGKIMFVDSISMTAPKTKDAVSVLSTLSKIDGFSNITSKKHTAVLIVVPEKTDMVAKSFANLPGATLMKTKELSALSAFNANHILFVEPDTAIEILSKKNK